MLKRNNKNEDIGNNISIFQFDFYFNCIVK